MNFINALGIGELVSDIFTMSLVFCLLAHLIFTKGKRLVSFCFALVVIQFINWNLNIAFVDNLLAGYFWYSMWMITDCLILFYVAFMAVKTGTVLKEEKNIAFLTLIPIFASLMRYIDVHFGNGQTVVQIYPYATLATNICIIVILLSPLAKGLVHYLGRKINGVTVFGLRFSVSSIRSNAVLANTESLQGKNRRIS